jgi:hypothetical protein
MPTTIPAALKATVTERVTALLTDVLAPRHLTPRLPGYRWAYRVNVPPRRGRSDAEEAAGLDTEGCSPLAFPSLVLGHDRTFERSNVRSLQGRQWRARHTPERGVGIRGHHLILPLDNRRLTPLFWCYCQQSVPFWHISHN